MIKWQNIGEDMKHQFLVQFVASIAMIGWAHAAPQAPEEVVLVTPDYIIEALDGSFVMEPDKPLPTPTEYDDPCFTDVNPMAMGPHNFRAPTTDRLKKGIKSGAAAVRVKNTATGESVFGRLLFCGIHKSQEAFGIARYKVQIPEVYFASALAGDLTGVYAKSNGYGFNSYVWILWLSTDQI
jgi:hypothetical protein